MGETGRTLTCPECCKPYLRGAKFCADCGTLINSLELDLLDLDGGSLPTGTLIGSYRLVELLGEGGMGRVYVAEHIKLGRRVAIKKLRQELISNPIAVARFFAEARAVNRISHENIVEITDLLEQPGGDNCIVMELLKGEDLAQRLRRMATLPLPRALGIAAQTASALAAVHEAGMIHRDLKPDNIFLIDRGGSPDFVKVLDFGVAKLADVNQGRGISVHTTAAGQIVGTPEYMSPEQGRGERVDHRTDIYALGVILYEMVTGHLPFEGTSFGELLMKHIAAPVVLPAPAAGVAAETQRLRDQLILELLAKQRDDRPASMAEVASRLRAMIDNLELPSPPRPRTVAPRASATEPVAKLSLVKRPTPQAAVELAVQRPGVRIEERRPSSPGGVLEAPLVPAAGADAGARAGARGGTNDRPPMPPGSDAPVAEPRLAKASSGRLAKSSSDAQPVAAPVAELAAVRLDAATTLDVMPSELDAAQPDPDPPADDEPLPRPARSWRAVALAAGIGVAIIGAIVVVTGRSEPAEALAPPPPPAEVKLRFVSAPPGATVRRLGTSQALGVTPFTASVPRADEPVTFELSKPGFATFTQVVIPIADDAVPVVLSPVSEPSPAPDAAAVPIVVPPGRPAKLRVDRPPADPAAAVRPPRRGPAAAPDRPLDRNATIDVFK